MTESRGIQYSAEAPGEPGNLRCHVVRLWLAQERRAQYSIFVCNGMDADAQAVAFVPDAVDETRRTILQTVIGPCSDFSTNVFLEVTPVGLMPELRIALTSSGGALFTLVILGLAANGMHGERSPSNGCNALPTGSATLATMPIVRGVYAPPAPPFVTTVQGRSSTVPEVTLQPSRPRATTAVMPMLLLFTAILATIGFFVARPQVISLGVPPAATAGTTVAIAYSVTGLAVADYAVIGPNGETVAHGPLALGASSFAFTVPQTPGAQAYLVRLHVGNSLVSAGAEDYLHVKAPAPPISRAVLPLAAPQIRSLALDRATLASGDPLTVYYDVSATRGSIALYDPASQITYGKSEIAPSGHTTVFAPHVESLRFLTVVATAQRGSATTQSRIGVTVTPAEASAPFDDTGEPQIDPTAVGSISAAGLSAPATVHSGMPIRVHIRGAAAGLELSLVDGAGRELARRDPQAGQRSVDFTAPMVPRPTRFVFEGTYPSGVGSETIVRGIIVTP